MQDWLAGETGGQYLTAILWTVGALVLLVIALMVARLLRRGASPFAGHGRDRRPRLAIGDSIEIDNQRRLILVRRDEVEHLILTGGPSDVVVEQGIRPSPAPVRREPAGPAVERHAPRPAPVAPVPAPVRQAEEPRPVPARPEPALDAPPAPSHEPLSVVPAAPRPVPPREGSWPEPRPAASPQQTADTPLPADPGRTEPRPVPAALGPEEDEVVEFPQTEAARLRRQPDAAHDSSLEDEMSRLLEDISDERR